MTKKEQAAEVRNALEYMIAEGMVVETSPGMYRLKTDKEIAQELQDLVD